MVDSSYLGSSDDVRGLLSSLKSSCFCSLGIDLLWIILCSFQVVRLMERVEATFIKHFANANRTKGMNILRPKAKRERHRITFATGKKTEYGII